jgi:geranylgeranyl diphosphate synthase type I
MFEAKQAAAQPGVDKVISGLHAEFAGQPEPVRKTIEVCTDVVQRPSKRVRAALTETGYRLVGGEDTAMISQAAGVVEAWHANLLIMDDYQDNSDTRRGGAAAHIAMGEYLEERHIGHDPRKLGTAAALNAAFILHIYANRVLGGLAVPSSNIIKASNLASDCLVKTGVGQSRDILSDPANPPSPAEILETYRLKTGIYTYYLPPAVGVLLGGGSTEEARLLLPYAEPAGQAFQLHDDILGIIGDPDITGKPSNDIAEGKYTWPMATAIERAGTISRMTLLRNLGNAALSDEDFHASREIIERTGAIADAQMLVGQLTQNAVDGLGALPSHWPADQVGFMRDLAVYGATRQA